MRGKAASLAAGGLLAALLAAVAPCVRAGAPSNAPPASAGRPQTVRAAIPDSPFLPARGPILGLGLELGSALARSPYWPLNAQPRFASSLSLEVPLSGIAGLGFTLGYHGMGSSPPSAGVLYRGHSGLEAGAYLAGHGRLGRGGERLRLRGGLQAGASASLDTYSQTELLFFYPSLLLEPCLELHFPRLGAHTFSLSLPARLDFRRDLELSASAGLGLRWRWYARPKGGSP
jgi:hypothetical protein